MTAEASIDQEAYRNRPPIQSDPEHSIDFRDLAEPAHDQHPTGIPSPGDGPVGARVRRGPAGHPLAASAAGEMPADNEIIRPYESQQHLTEQEFDSGWRGTFQRFGAKFLNPQYQRLFVNSGLVDLRNESTAAMNRMSREYTQKTFGSLDLDALGKWFNDNTAALQIPRKIRERVALNGQEQALYDANKPALDQFMLGKDGDGKGFFRLLDEARASGLAQGNLGPTYYPRQYRTIGDALRALPDITPEDFRDIVLGNLEKKRFTRFIPNDVPTETAQSYIRQVIKAQVLKPEIESVEALRDGLQAEEKSAVNDWLRNNVRNDTTMMDETARDMLARKIGKEQTPVGTKFQSDGSLGPSGEIEVQREAGIKKGARDEHGNLLPGQEDQPLYQISANGKTDSLLRTRNDVLAMKYSSTVLDRMPVSSFLNAWSHATSWLVVAGNLRTFFSKAIGDTARIVTQGGAGPSDMAYGLKAWGDYLAGKMSPEMLGELQDVGAIDRRLAAASMGEAMVLSDRPMSLAERIAFANVHVPQTAAATVAYLSFKRALLRDNPGMSPQVAQTLAMRHASMVTDMVLHGSRSPMSYDPMFRAAMYLQNASLRQFEQLADFASKGQWGRMGAAVGVRAAMFAGLYSLVGKADVKEIAKKLLELLPFSSIAEGRAWPMATIPLQKTMALLQTADNATGGNARSVFGLRPANYKQQQATMRQALPSMAQPFFDRDWTEMVHAKTPKRER